MGEKRDLLKNQSNKTKDKVSSAPQTTVARRLAEADLRALVEKFASTHSRLLGQLRRWLRKRLPTAHEVVYEYQDFLVISVSPDDRGYEGVFAIRASGEGVKLYFNHGKQLPDPGKLLQGSGKQTRFLAVDGKSTLERAEVLTLVDEAIARNRIPFAETGRGSVIIRSTLAKRRAQMAATKSAPPGKTSRKPQRPKPRA